MGRQAQTGRDGSARTSASPRCRARRGTRWSTRGYTGLIEIDEEAGILFGRVAGIKDVVIFQAENVPALRRAFEESVDDYREFCEVRGEEPEKPVAEQSKATDTNPDRFIELCAKFPPRLIRDEDHFDRAVAFAMALDQGELSVDEYDYLEVPLTVIEAYQDEHHSLPGPKPTPAQMLKYLIEDAQRVSQAEVAEATGISESTIAGTAGCTEPIPATSTRRCWRSISTSTRACS